MDQPEADIDLQDSLVEQFCALTGASEQISRATLEASNWNIDFAVNMHMDSQMHEAAEAPVLIDPVADLSNDLPVAASSSGHQASSSMVDDDNVRAPIPPKRQILVEGPPYQSYQPYPTRNYTPTRSVFDQLRNFEAEAQWREQLMDDESELSIAAAAKRRTLEELFRPPLDLIFTGSMDSAKETGAKRNKWLMVNVQDSQEFKCQVLNRDVWSNQAVKTIINEHFIFWQVYKDSAEGMRYMQFYPFTRFPYVAVLDPRTGELLVSWHTIVDSVTFCDFVTEFLSGHPSPDGSINSISPAKEDEVQPANGNSAEIDSKNAYEESEDEQLKRAIAASLQDVPGPSRKVVNVIHDEDDSDLETFQPSDDESNLPEKIEPNIAAAGDVEEKPSNQVDNWEYYLGSGPIIEFVLRYPDGKRETMSFPIDSRMKALYLYLESQGYSLKEFDVVTNFPRKNYHDVPPESSLSDAGLAARETLFIQHKT
ncbi:UBX domain-containing protein 7 [Halotydeus destructor]|nr:UBX domain-containing protein 7 [Halotydeus destructor]